MFLPFIPVACKPDGAVNMLTVRKLGDLLVLFVPVRDKKRRVTQASSHTIRNFTRETAWFELVVLCLCYGKSSIKQFSHPHNARERFNLEISWQSIDLYRFRNFLASV